MFFFFVLFGAALFCCEAPKMIYGLQNPTVTTTTTTTTTPPNILLAFGVEDND